MANHPHRSRNGEYAIVVLRSDVPAGQRHHASGIRTAGDKLVTFASVEAATRYLPKYVEWVRQRHASDASWARYRSATGDQVFLVVRAADVSPFGNFRPNDTFATIPYRDFWTV